MSANGKHPDMESQPSEMSGGTSWKRETKNTQAHALTLFDKCSRTGTPHWTSYA